MLNQSSSNALARVIGMNSQIVKTCSAIRLIIGSRVAKFNSLMDKVLLTY